MIKPDIRKNLPVWGKAMLLLIPGFGGGLIAFWIGLPMPFMLGSLFVTAAYCIWRSSTTGRPLYLPASMRRVSIAVIGTMIGAEFSPEITSVLPSIWASLAGAAAFVVVAYIIGFQIFRKIGRYGPATALFSAMPGGFIEATALGERAGADLQLVTVQHFARIVLVVTLIPLLFFAWSGIAVGSAGGQTFSDLPHDLSDYASIGLISVAGIFAGKMLRFPASHMAGPLILSAAAHSLGWAEIQSPDWLLFLAQLIVGTGLGTQFSGVGGRLLAVAFGLGILSVVAMLSLAGATAFAVVAATPYPYEALLLSYSPGGVTEMGLIALSLSMSPIFVSMHHLFRILLTVLVAGLAAKIVNVKFDD